MNRLSSISQIFGYTMSVILFLAGGLMVVGIIGPAFVGGSQLRSLFGAVLILYSIFRFVSVYFGTKREEGD